MTPRTIALILGTAAFSASAFAAQDYLTITKAETEWTYSNGKKSLKIELETANPVPTDGRSGAFGYAALTDGGNNVLVLVTHLPIDDSSYEKVPSGFHTHVLDLKAPTAACSGATFEVDLEGSAKNAAFDANYHWEVERNEVEIEQVPASDVSDAGVENIASFTLKPVLGSDGKPSNLCVTVVKQI